MANVFYISNLILNYVRVRKHLIILSKSATVYMVNVTTRMRMQHTQLQTVTKYINKKHQRIKSFVL